MEFSCFERDRKGEEIRFIQTDETVNFNFQFSTAGSDSKILQKF
jgi:hypothetical protein